MPNIKQNIVFTSAKFVFIELIGDIIYFPIWWYSKGVKISVFYFWQKLVNGQRFLGVWVWVTSLFKPMYGQTDWQSKLISFFIRLVNIILRLAVLVVWAVVVLIGFIIWMALPILIVYQIGVILYNILYFY